VSWRYEIVDEQEFRKRFRMSSSVWGMSFFKKKSLTKHFTRCPLFRVTPSSSQDRLSLNWYMVFVREMGSTNLNYRLNDLRVNSRENDSSNRYERLSEHIWSK